MSPRVPWRASALAAGLGAIPGVRIRSATPESNMVFFDLSALDVSTAAALAQLQKHGVKLGGVGGALRAVTHLDISDIDITHTLQAVAAIAADASVMRALIS
jgi:threonine aldolase